MVWQKIKKQATHTFYTHLCTAARGTTAGKPTGAWEEGAMAVGEGKAAQCGHE